MTSHIGQEPPDDYLDKVVQSWAFAEEHMTHDKSELAVVPTTSLQPTQFQKTQVLQSQQKQSDPIDYPRSGSKKRQSLESPIQRSSQKIQKKSDDKPLVLDQISQEADSNENENIPIEKWCAPAGFSLDFDDPSLKKT
ncbi:17528_t:CDS:2, partial [Entrophospora sp. SA101]